MKLIKEIYNFALSEFYIQPMVLKEVAIKYCV